MPHQEGKPATSPKQWGWGQQIFTYEIYSIAIYMQYRHGMPEIEISSSFAVCTCICGKFKRKGKETTAKYQTANVFINWILLRQQHLHCCLFAVAEYSCVYARVCVRVKIRRENSRGVIEYTHLTAFLISPDAINDGQSASSVVYTMENQWCGA